MEIYEAILKSSHQYNFPDDSLYGYGIPDFCMANIILSQKEKSTSEGNIQFFHNPFKSSVYFTLSTSLTQNIIVDLCDIFGKKVYSGAYFLNKNTVNTIEIKELSKLAKGLYILTVTGNGIFYSEKIIKE
jgi:hypothetical protein